MTAFDMAQRFVGEVREIPGEKHHPFIQWCFMLCGWDEETPDEVPWCSVFVNGVAWLLRLPRSKSARARSWLQVGVGIDNLSDAKPGHDVVILKRGGGNQPGPDVINAPGHVGLFAGWQEKEDDIVISHVLVLGGNQSNAVTVAPYPKERILGIRRLA